MPLGTQALADATLRALQRVAAGQAPAPEDMAAVAARVPDFLAGLASRRVLGPAPLDPADLPAPLFEDLVRAFAETVAPVFHIPRDDAALAAAESRLATASRLDLSGDPLVLLVLEQIELLGASSLVLDAGAIARRLPEVLAELALRGILTATDPAQIPIGAAPDLARYLAASLAGPSQQPLMRAAEDRLRALAAPEIFVARPQAIQVF